MADKQIKVATKVLLAWLVLAGFILFLMPREQTDKLQLAFAGIFKRPLNIGRDALLFGRQGSAGSVSAEQYNRLRNHLANITEQLHNEHRKVEELSGLRNRMFLEGAKLVCGDVITISQQTTQGKLVVNRGTSDGLAQGQFVLAEDGIIGTVSDVFSNTAMIKLVTDPAFKIAVKVGNLDAGAAMQGDGCNSAKIPMVAKKYAVESGDMVYALKQAGFLSTALIVGTVGSCASDAENPLLWDIRVTPVCDIGQLKSVNVIVTNQPQQPARTDTGTLSDGKE